MQRKKINLLIAPVFFLTTFFYLNSVWALGLIDAYEAALANDSVYRSARFENEAGQQFKLIGRANLLPNLSANYAYNRNNSHITTQNALFTRREDRDYNSENGAIQLRQPIINLENWALYRQGNAQTKLSDKQLLVSHQALITRFFELYVSANYAEDVLALAVAQRDALKLQVDANQLMAVRGEGTKTALIESQAKLGLAQAQVIESQDSVIDSRNALALMLGQKVTTLDALTSDFNPPASVQLSFEEWKNLALQNNPEIAAQRESIEIAYQQIKRNRAGHAPRLDAVASLSKSKSDTVATFQQDIDNKSIGLQLNVPLYSGGSVNALTTQAEANYRKSQADLDSKTNEVLLNLRKNFSSLASSALKIEALKQSVASAELLITATKKSLIGGVRTNLDVLDARSQLFIAKRDLSLARYNYLVAYIGLRNAAGNLNADDLKAVSIYFIPQVNTELLADVFMQQ